MGILDRATPVGDVPKHLFIALWGAGGVGKTICAARTANRTLLITDEKAAVSLSQFPDLAKTVDVLPFTTFSDLTSLVRELYAGKHPYDHFLIDTFDGVIRKKLKEQRQKVKFSRGHEDISSLEDYNLLNNHMADFIGKLAMLPISVTITSHDRIPDEKSYVKGDRLLRPSVPFRVFETLNGYANVVGYMHMRKLKVKDDQGGREKTELRRVIALQSNDEYTAKNHLKLPAIVTDETFISTVRNWKGI